VKVKTYKPEEIRQATFDFFQGDELATKVWISKYALKDSFGNIFEKNAGRYAQKNCT
jgi:ribonucleoside-diphosphate reductase alpha chain